LSQKELAEKLDIPSTAISKYERGEVKPSSEILAKFGESLGANINWLLTGKGEMFIGQAEPSLAVIPSCATEHDATERIPVYDIAAAAGGGAWNGPENITGYIALSRQYLAQVLFASARNLCVISVRGDSMQPTLQSGDMVIVDKSVDEIHDNIYLVRMGETLLVKRVQRIPKNQIRLLSDNPLYPPVDVSLEEAVILGRVIWFGRHIR